MDDSAEPKARKRTQRTVAEWRSIMARHEARGLTCEASCAAEGIGRSAFWRWRRRLADEDRRAPGTARRRSSNWPGRARRRGTPSSTSARAWCCGCAGRGADPGGGAAHLAVRRAGGHAPLVRRLGGAGAQPPRGGPGRGRLARVVNRRRTIVKVLSFDGGGYWVWGQAPGGGAVRRAARPGPQAGAGPDRAAGPAGRRRYGGRGRRKRYRTAA